jgi:hypothetical protein
MIPFLLRAAATFGADSAGATALALVLCATVTASAISRGVAGRLPDVTFDDAALALAVRAVHGRTLHLVAVESHEDRSPAACRDREIAQRDVEPTLTGHPVLLLEIGAAGDPVARCLSVRGLDVDGYPVLRTDGRPTPGAITAIALALRDASGTRPRLHFTWPDGNGAASRLRRHLLVGTTPHRSRRCLARTERDVARRPTVHIAG